MQQESPVQPQYLDILLKTLNPKICHREIAVDLCLNAATQQTSKLLEERKIQEPSPKESLGKAKKNPHSCHDYAREKSYSLSIGFAVKFKQNNLGLVAQKWRIQVFP